MIARVLSKPLSQEDIAFFRSMLNQQLEDLLDQAKKTVAQLIQGEMLGADILDRASSEMGCDYIIRIRDRESRLIQKIKATLDKIEEGSFGICESCGQAITYARLLARPVAAYCIACKSRMEAMEKRRGI